MDKIAAIISSRQHLIGLVRFAIDYLVHVRAIKTLRNIQNAQYFSTIHATNLKPKKFREKSIADRRLELGLMPTSPRINGKIGSLPLAVVQSGTKQYPLVLEEASVVAGATGMLKLIGDTFTVKHLASNNTCVISCEIPFASLSKSDANGKEMAEGIVDIYKFSEREPMRAITNNKGILNAVYPFFKSICAKPSAKSMCGIIGKYKRH